MNDFLTLLIFNKTVFYSYNPMTFRFICSGNDVSPSVTIKHLHVLYFYSNMDFSFL